ncbi:MAG: glycine betaine ABC transporter substrate-binding protein [Arthrobacter sp.]|uniref:glycine betaine ABC transporter substrate-binding protein n=1 Tax=unclassified Arthrobacter TaxID=235627 RepID=UPI002655F3E0|nr:glycine betaine ABC transporter substrate-binding protein [Micrococcaceae bacterium]MDN5823497.1 glycine betaine ABC transporter substrate-binding protein [Micrococcaceae bacterium]MDN5880025.1 glycine betaine ABC transporter substrate-binding protein [Micrococcaceae bacterium]MDN5885692.1 glycine betaine ABC transporter substrate-binding protein [Micrococcaceae bacterium]MDN5906410.1 glycine betaine ABC transporter substrate-binding protein [Micrococcaceae bacterium]
MQRKFASMMGIAATAALALTACGSGDTGSSESEVPDSPENGDQAALNIGVMAGWDEGVAVSNLWKQILDKKGYDVELTDADAGPVFAGVASGDLDLTMDVWMPLTHKKYLKKYGDDMTKLGTWYDDAKLTIAVNEDAPIDSLEDLAANADKFGNTIYGIDPGAGLTDTTEKAAIPDYGLEKMDFKTSSTPAMLAQLKKATDADEDIVVTLWRPHWAYDEFPIKDLKDPKGAMGDAETITSYGNADFADTYPGLTEWLNDFTIDDDHLFSLENAMFNDTDTDDYGPIVDKWISENQDYVDSLTEK